MGRASSTHTLRSSDSATNLDETTNDLDDQDLDGNNHIRTRAFRGSLVHSVGLGHLEIFEDALLTVGLSGRIVDLIDLESPQCGGDSAGAARSAVVKGMVMQWREANPALEFVDLSGTGKLLVPGFVDAHAHAPQYAFVGTGMDLPLLQWLETYTFPCESKFSDASHAKRVYEKVVRRHLSYGTTFTSWFATIHLEASKALVDIVQAHGQRAHVGKVSMDRNSPEYYVEKDTARGLREVEEFVDYVHAKNADEATASEARRKALLEAAAVTSPSSAVPTTTTPIATTSVQRSDAKQGAVHTVALTSCPSASSPPLVTPSIIPRFVPSCTSEMMRGLGDISRTRSAKGQAKQGSTNLSRGSEQSESFLPVHSHLSESPAEISWVKDLHPECDTYADVYRSHGLLHQRSYMAHCCHCCPAERGVLKNTGCGVVHCPSSNFMLKSGVMDVRTALNEGIKVALGSDIAGGYSSSILDAMRQTIIASRVSSFNPPTNGKRVSGGSEYTPLTYAEAFHLATVGGAEVLGMGNKLGNLRPGKHFDAIVVDPHAVGGPIDLFGGESTLERFEKFLFLGDDRNVEQVYVNGNCVMTKAPDGTNCWPLAEATNSTEASLAVRSVA